MSSAPEEIQDSRAVGRHDFLRGATRIDPRVLFHAPREPSGLYEFETSSHRRVQRDPWTALVIDCDDSGAPRVIEDTRRRVRDYQQARHERRHGAANSRK